VEEGAWSAGRVVGFGALFGAASLAVFAIAVAYPFAAQAARDRANEAERLAREAELARLRAHLQPHFLLNTLNAVSGMIGRHPDEARELLGELGELLSDSLHEDEGGELHTLEKEIAWLRRYATILEARHGAALRFRWEIARGAERVRLPRLLLQPLVENAVRHGALRRRGGGEIAIRATMDEERADRVVCTIEDNGPGLSGAPPRQGALGLSMVRRRLELEYAGAAILRLESEGGLTRSIVELPAGTHA
jgi:LytS/YehU family sensor histidine kinase